MKILNKLTIKHLKMNKKRTVVTIIGVLLSTALMVGIGLLFSTVRDFAIRDIIKYNGSHHVQIYDLSYEKVKQINNNVNIKEIAFEKGIGFAYFKESKELYKPYFYVNSVNEVFLETLKLKEGRLPKNSNEVVIPEHILSSYNYQIGDTLDLELGYRYHAGAPIDNNDEYYHMGYDSEEETLIIETSQKYTIVGIIERSYHESYSAPGYEIYTKLENIKDDDLVNVFITYRKISKVYDKTETLVKSLNIDLTNVDYNDALISMYGENKYSNVNNAMVKIITIVLSLIAVGCIMVIYNSFAISVIERKKQFGLFSSIGATKYQLRKMVFYEAFIVGIIGIPLGLLSGFFGIWVVLQITNNLLSDVFMMDLELAVYPLFVIIPIIFMIVVIIFSAFLPARRASKITPIEAIRLNDDIKIKGKKVKTSKLTRKVFGIEGEISLKNMKRNKRKYRITIISLFISIVLFISFSSLLTYVTIGTTRFFNDIDFDIYVEVNDPDKTLLNKTINDIINTSEVDKYTIFRGKDYMTNGISDKDYHKDYQPILDNNNQNNIGKGEVIDELKPVMIITMDNKNYKAYLKELGLKEERPIFINSFAAVDYSNGSRKVYQGKLLKSKDDREIPICNMIDISNYDDIKCDKVIDNIYETTKLPFGFSFLTELSQPIIVVSETYFNELITTNLIEVTDPNYIILIKAKEYKQLDKKLNDYVNEYKLGTLNYFNIKEQSKMIRNITLVIKILFYGFISLVTLIGVTSVFNTINTSIALRRREFAVLRSMGITPKGFNRLLQFETLIVGLKALFYALPVSLGIIYLINRGVNEMVSFSNMMIPWSSILFAVIGDFVIVSITMWYATKKIKKENILEAIREENI